MINLKYEFAYIIFNLINGIIYTRLFPKPLISI